MKNLIKIIWLVCLVNTAMIHAQDKALKRANKQYDNFAYINAINAYENIVEKGNGSLEVYQKLGDSYYFNSDLESAAKWYKEMIDTGGEIPSAYYFRAAQSFKFLKKYDVADSYMELLKSSNKGDSRIQEYLDNPNYLKDIKKQSGRYEVVNLGTNSVYTDFAPSYYKEQLVFSSSREKGSFSDQKNRWTKQPYLKLYSSDIGDNDSMSSPVEFSTIITTRLHESTATFTKDESTIYFTRNNLFHTKSKEDSINVNRLKIFSAKIQDNKKWRDIKELPFNNDQFSVAHPALSTDEKKLYFVSDMPGGYGMSDLYVVDILDNETYGEPQNLGPEINTEGRETFPFIDTKGMLYFASDGHLGLGGLDIFVVQLDNDVKEIYNVGEPVNSSADDITFIIDNTTSKGYFASNRPGGKGDDDIYSFIELSPLVKDCNGSIKGTVMDEKSGALVKNATLEIKDLKGETSYTTKTDDKGAFFQEVDCNNKTYQIEVVKDDYDPMKEEFTVTKANPNLDKNLKLKNKVPEEQVDLAKLLNLKHIYFESDKSFILKDYKKELDKVYDYMKEYPSASIKIESHTDTTGSDEYNMQLSNRRALATANYIISKGIDPSRIKSKGYGETMLKVTCKNGSKCTRKENAQNRRSEIYRD